MTPFGPQLIGETEKSLNAILRGILADSGLTETHWVTLRIAATHDGDRPLVDAVAGRAYFADAAAIVGDLRARGLLEGDRVSGAGAELLARLGAQIKNATTPIWADLPEKDVVAATRVLNLVGDRAREVLSR